MPEPPASEPLQVTDSGLRYQPAAFGARLALATVVGPCVSYLTMNGSEELLPAMSVHVPLTLVPFVSGPLWLRSVRHDATPDPPVSVPSQLRVNGALNQPAPLGGRLGSTVVSGGTVSYLTRNESDELLPALSVQLPVLFAPVVCGPLYESVPVQDAIPDVASVPGQEIENGALNQPAALGWRLGVAVVVGGSASILSDRVVIVVVPPSLVAEHVLVVPVVGPGIWMAGSQPVVDKICDSGSLTDQRRVMLLPCVLPRYQSLVPAIPSIEYDTTGGVSSDAGSPRAVGRNSSATNKAATAAFRPLRINERRRCCCPRSTRTYPVGVGRGRARHTRSRNRASAASPFPRSASGKEAVAAERRATSCRPCARPARAAGCSSPPSSRLARRTAAKRHGRDERRAAVRRGPGAGWRRCCGRPCCRPHPSRSACSGSGRSSRPGRPRRCCRYRCRRRSRLTPSSPASGTAAGPLRRRPSSAA